MQDIHLELGGEKRCNGDPQTTPLFTDIEHNTEVRVIIVMEVL